MRCIYQKHCQGVSPAAEGLQTRDYWGLYRLVTLVPAFPSTQKSLQYLFRTAQGLSVGQCNPSTYPRSKLHSGCANRIPL